jgi:hypothetical protein
MTEPKYKCPSCSCECTVDEMHADYAIMNEDGDEAWCNYVCPQCGMWYDLEDYEKLP